MLCSGCLYFELFFWCCELFLCITNWIVCFCMVFFCFELIVSVFYCFFAFPFDCSILGIFLHVTPPVCVCLILMYKGCTGWCEEIRGGYEGVRGEYEGVRGEYEGVRGEYEGVRGRYEGGTRSYEGLRGGPFCAFFALVMLVFIL